ncbi:hypothetical protein FNB79_11330 [Formosa sediminum]|uniref:Uncharacterized protein n=1 Tax=Formosa sediminum TaxID=2594004 RepID=A0A516GSN8_9FLAO|nr:hypothetical protein [Formosa sediminum]QDO94532.1 hypothetical protein FNB79_11330 [Formosa sediminum]
MQTKLTYLFLLGVIVLSSFAIIPLKNASVDIKLQTTATDYPVGTHVLLHFTTSNNTEKPLLYCSNSYGSTIIKPTINNNGLDYVIPKTITNKIGTINWKLIANTHTHMGKINMLPKNEVASMETYIGPPSIEAGGTDYSMLVVIPTDSLDNPVPTNTLVTAKHQFLTSEETQSIYTNNLIAYSNIYSKKESGRMLVASECLGINSKEFTINVMAAIPTNFKIEATRPHNYADGNQITTFTTSVIKDKHNNRVSDGTFVTFYITNKNQDILKTTGTTIEGIATAKMIHPDYADTWSIKAYINGMAESNSISLNYLQVIHDFDVKFKAHNRTITVGPLQSFMQQMIPDGLHVQLKIYKDNILVETLTKTSFNGYATFKLKPAIYTHGTYSFTFETAGIKKQFKTISLW